MRSVPFNGYTPWCSRTKKRRWVGAAAIAAAPLATFGMIAWVVIEARGAESDDRANEAVFAAIADLTCDEINALVRERAAADEKRTSRIVKIGGAMPYVGGTLVALSMLVLIPVRKQGQG